MKYPWAGKAFPSLQPPKSGVFRCPFERGNPATPLGMVPPMCYGVFMIDETDLYPTQEELRQAMNKAVRRGFMKPNGDGTFSITEAGEEYVIEFLLTPDTIH
jgi:hypothetical protein